MEENTDLYIETQHLSQLLIFKALQNLKFEISKVFEDIRIRQNYAVNVKFLSEKTSSVHILLILKQIINVKKQSKSQERRKSFYSQ